MEVTDDVRFKNSELAKTLSLNTDGLIVKSEQPKIEWVYETGREEPEILGSGSHLYNVVKTKDKEEAFRLSKECARNYISRYHKVDGKRMIT